MRRLMGVLAFVSLVAAGPAAASSIYYHCAAGICRVAPDGSGQQTVASGDYTSPSVSLDGNHLAWIQGTADLFTGDGSGGSAVGPITRYATYAVISPDGTKVLAYEAAVPPIRVCVYDVAGGSCSSQGGGAITSAGWYPGDRVMISSRDSNDPVFQTNQAYYNNQICLLVPAGGGTCEKVLAYDAEFQLDDPALSPDGSTLAVARSPWDHTDQRQIALYNASTGAFEKVITSGPGDETPFWSPDGSQIAFSRSGGIYVVSPAGSPGSERKVADGDSPTWSTVGKSSGGTTAAPKLAAPKSQKGTKVHLTVTVPAPGTRVLVQLVAQGYLIGKKSVARSPAGRRSFAVALNRKLVKALRSKHVHKLVVTVRVAVGGTVLQRTITLRL